LVKFFFENWLKFFSSAFQKFIYNLVKFVAKKKIYDKFFSPLSFVAAFGSGILDAGWVKSGSGINIPDPQQ
jgi:hypothetical protein